MRKVVWEDSNGYKRVSLIRNNDPDSFADKGIPCGPPDLSDILENAKKTLHNRLVERGLLSYNDVVSSQNGVTSAVLSVLKREVIAAYRLAAQEKKEIGGLKNGRN